MPGDTPSPQLKFAVAGQAGGGTAHAPDKALGVVSGCAAVTSQRAEGSTKSRATPLLAKTCLAVAGGSAEEQHLA